MTRRLVVEAPAKINLHLAVGPIRSDGYHALESVFHAIDLCDTLVVETAGAFSFRCGSDLGIAEEDNIVTRTAHVMAETFDREPNVRIELVKRIPHGAGLGGGSSDAAATILALACLWGVSADDARCREVATAIGADVPFFLVGGAALMGGRGDELLESLPALSSPLVVVKPGVSVSTPAAYRRFDEAPVSPESSAAICTALRSGDSAAVGASLFNNMESAVSELVPEIAAVVSRLSVLPGILGARMSGSGSAVFAICENESVAREAASRESARGNWAVATSLRASGIQIVEGVNL